MRMPLLVGAGAALMLSMGAARADITTYTIDFFPEDPGTYLQQLRMMGPTVGTIVETRVYIDFTTTDGFQAQDFYFELFAPVDNAAFGYLGLTGMQLGWTGEGTFHAQITSHDLDGELLPRLWAWHLWSVNDPPELRGSFSVTSRVEVDIDVPPQCGTADFNGDGDVGTDADIEAFFACLAGNCCDTCFGADFNSDGDTGTDADIEAFFRVLAGGEC